MSGTPLRLLPRRPRRYARLRRALAIQPHTAAVIHCSSFCFGAAPIWREASSPFLKIIRVGIDMMPYLVAVAGFSSTLSFTTLILPAIVPAISSSAGAIIRHGPHHSAQKSTTTGSCALSTSASKVASDTLPTPMGHLVFLPKKGRVRRPRNRRSERRNAGRERQGAADGGAAMKTGET